MMHVRLEKVTALIKSRNSCSCPGDTDAEGTEWVPQEEIDVLKRITWKIPSLVMLSVRRILRDPAMRDESAEMAFRLWADRLTERLQDQEGLRTSEELQLHLTTLSEMSVGGAELCPTFSFCKPVSPTMPADWKVLCCVMSIDHPESAGSSTKLMSIFVPGVWPIKCGVDS